MAVPGQGEGHHAQPTSAGLAGSTQVDCGTEVVGQIYFPGGASIFSGSGAPGKLVNGKPPALGDVYFRLDGTLGSTWLYRCTVGGANPTWVASTA